MAEPNRAKSIWPWKPPLLTFERSSLPPSSDGGGPVLQDPLDQIPKGEDIGTVPADGAYDRCRRHTAITDRQTADIQIRIAPMNCISARGSAKIVCAS